MFQKQLGRKSLPKCVLQTIAILLSIPPGCAFAQTVQLPTVGTFSLNTSVLAPDSGTAYMGGNRRNAMGSQALGIGSSAFGSTSSAASASVRATIIDLNELDLMIRSQAGSKPTIPDLNSHQSKPSKYANGILGTAIQNAGYEYLAALTHEEKAGSEQISSDTTYYLSLASNARQQRHWAAVELYYKLAWQSLPESRRESVLKSLAEARRKVAVEPSKSQAK